MSGKKYRGFLAGLVFLAAMPFGTVRAFAGIEENMQFVMQQYLMK